MPIATYLIIGVNILISLRAFTAFRQEGRSREFLFIPAEVARGYNYQGMFLSHFSHADAGHLLFNMITLYYFGTLVEARLGIVPLLAVYGVSAVASNAVIYLLHRHNPGYRALGASDSVTGVLFAAIVLEPRMSVYFFLIPVPIPAPLFAIGYIALSTYFMRRQAGHVSHEAHLAGACAGILLGGLLAPLGYAPLIHQLSRMFS